MYGKQPISLQIPFFPLLPIRHILQLSYEPKIAKKGGSCYQLWTIKQVPFFSGKITIFQPTACLPGYCKVPIWANGWFLWPKWVPRHIRTCPRLNFENKNLGSCGEISASRTTVQCSNIIDKARAQAKAQIFYLQYLLLFPLEFLGLWCSLHCKPSALLRF